MTALGRLQTPEGCIRNTDEDKDCNACYELFALTTDNLYKSPCLSFPLVRWGKAQLNMWLCQSTMLAFQRGRWKK